MNQIFLNYRTADERFGVALLDHELSRAFGPEAVFFASKSIELGSEWEQYLFDAVKASEALLVVIGRNWLDAANADGDRLLDDPQDFVRREITTAFELGKRVIPVLLETPRIPREELPAPLRQLADVQDIRIQFRNAVPDIDRLAKKLEQLIPGLRRISPAETGTKFTAHAHQGGVVNQYERVDVRGDFHAGPR
ncbi:toll/interleukin-1 receptor domain-containing protein [Amycolatopsis sp. NPDC054798]